LKKNDTQVGAKGIENVFITSIIFYDCGIKKEQF
jgi:hypothetical protein